MKVTERTLRIINNAEKLSEKQSAAVHPAHLLLGILLERTSVCAELNHHYPELWAILYKRTEEIQFAEKQGVDYSPFKRGISLPAKLVMKDAINLMGNYKQTYVNEGHIAAAVLHSSDDITKTIIEGLDVSLILEIIASPRDMVVSLRDYAYPDLQTSNITFRRANPGDLVLLKGFVASSFGDRWLDALENAFANEKIPVFLAINREEIIGFACFDATRNKKGLFGPMGTVPSKRGQGIGFTLLHLCLSEMKNIGYEYAVIGEAGPVEFYEKACHAVVIPKSL